MLAALALLQLSLALVLLRRLGGGRTRRPPEAPLPQGLPASAASSNAAHDAESEGLTIVVATLNEASRIAPCLRGLLAQGAPVREILVVDSGSSDGTREMVAEAAARDPRIRLLTDPPLPAGWIGKAWALQFGTQQASQPWVLGMDADTEANPGCAAAVLHAARREGFDVVSFAPRFDGQTAMERWLQPALLVTLIYRSGAVGDPRIKPDRVIANGQCFLARRATLLAHGGYEPVKDSFAEDVSLVRHLASRGASVGFLDGSRLYRVRSYSGVGQMWREWGRSLDLKDATSRPRQWLDTAFVVLAQGMWLPAGFALTLAWPTLPASPWTTLLLTGTAVLVAVRWLLLLAIAPSYERRGITWWLSPLADPLAALRLVISTLRRPTRWRTRVYGSAPAT
ncbi:MAG TPA: glycosyltransferase family 2 protein [Gemmatimonadaceae bacterium]|nr:glycosyltransferase family 2 protein [Gemmatimonadaceae bacterium]